MHVFSRKFIIYLAGRELKELINLSWDMWADGELMMLDKPTIKAALLGTEASEEGRSEINLCLFFAGFCYAKLHPLTSRTSFNNLICRMVSLQYSFRREARMSVNDVNISLSKSWETYHDSSTWPFWEWKSPILVVGHEAALVFRIALQRHLTKTVDWRFCTWEIQNKTASRFQLT